MASFNYGNSHPDNFALDRNGSSLFSLTFEEFQKVLGEPGANMGSMNMDELLRNIWTAEESQAMAAAMNSSEKVNSGLLSQISLQKQGSLSLPRTLSGKSVEDVWKSLQPQDGGIVASGANHHQRQMTLGEVTLEDFLVRAGVVKASQALVSRNAPAMPTNLLSNQVHVTQTQVPASQVHQSSRSQVLPPSNQLHPVQAMKIPNQVPKPSISVPTVPASRFVGFGGNLDFPFQSVGGSQTVENLNGMTSPSNRNTFVTSSADVLLLPDQMGFQTLDSISLQGNHGDWVSGSNPKNITQQNQHGQGFTQRQLISESTSVLGSSPNVANVPFLSSPTRRLSPSSGGTGAALGAGGGLGLGFGGNAIHFGSGSPLSPSLDEMSPEPNDLPLSLIAEFATSGHQHRKKRCGEGPVEKLIERRQRRMIKNRESAARSRARKQAYTVELEAEVSQLKEENMKLLRKQEEDAARRKQQILALMPSPAINGGYQKLPLKRTHTGPW